MNCPKCGKNLEFKKKQIDVDKDGQPILNEYAICQNCKKQWNLDKQKAQYTKASQPSENMSPKKESTPPEKEKPSESNRSERKKTSSPKTKEPQKNSVNAVSKNSTPQKSASPEKSSQTRYSNIPSKKMRTKKETTVKQNYKDMLDADPNRKPPLKKKKAIQKGSAPQKKPIQLTQNPPGEKNIDPPKFRTFRIIMGILSIILFGMLSYKAFMLGLSDTSSGNKTSAGAILIVLALCMLISGSLLLIMQANRTIFAFLLPITFYIAGAALAFLGRKTNDLLLFASIGGAMLAITFMILAILSKSYSMDNAKEYPEKDDEDDEEEDDDDDNHLFDDIS